ncbi:MAG: TlpA family protein disulfide reductase [Deltaproteobacteria bacterium]|nr:TlpA family protein disulfide reductase [Deltaproteobacteria bacterium]
MNLSFVRKCFLALSLTALCSCSSSSTSSSLIGKPAPATRITMMSGEALPLDEFRGKTVVLTFWATWCSHSSQTLGEIGELSQRYANRPDIVFLTVSVDKADDIEKVRTRLTDSRLAGTRNAFSGNAEYDEAFMSFRCNDLPRIFIINPLGIIIAEGSKADIVAQNLH